MALVHGSDGQQDQAHPAALSASSTSWATASPQHGSQIGTQAMGDGLVPQASSAYPTQPVQAQGTAAPGYLEQSQTPTQSWSHDQQPATQSHAPPPTAIHLARAGAGTGRAGTRRHQTIAGNRRGVGNPASTAVNQKHRAGRRYTQQAPRRTPARRKRRSSRGPAQTRFGRTRAGRATLTTSGPGKAYRPRHHRDKAMWRLISARTHGT